VFVVGITREVIRKDIRGIEGKVTWNEDANVGVVTQPVGLQNSSRFGRSSFERGLDDSFAALRNAGKRKRRVAERGFMLSFLFPR
jgi:hypothetical protein